jgi:fatty acid desaturase
MTGDAPGGRAANDNRNGKDAALKALRRRILIWGCGAGTITAALTLWFAPGAPWWFHLFVLVVSGTVTGRLASGIARTKGIIDEV